MPDGDSLPLPWLLTAFHMVADPLPWALEWGHEEPAALHGHALCEKYCQEPWDLGLLPQQGLAGLD